MNAILADGESFVKAHEDKFSPTAYDLVEKLLRFEPKLRLGCGEAGVDEIKQHPYFASIDWEKLERKEVESPFKPEMKHEAAQCVCNFEEEFTNMPLNPSPTNQRFKDLYAQEVQLDSFTYVKSEFAEVQADQKTASDLSEVKVRSDSIHRDSMNEGSSQVAFSSDVNSE